MEVSRCPWCLKDEAYIRYHDREWGTPLKDGQKLFELLLLEGAQAGLSWLTILKNREGYRAAFDGFDPRRIARYGDAQIGRLMEDRRIIRNRRKILSAIQNARAYLAMQESKKPFARWIWDFVDDTPQINHYKTIEEIPPFTDLSTQISKELKKKGFSFVGPTIMYSFIQSAGLINDHLVSCFRHPFFTNTPKK